MAINAAMNWWIRAGGSANNGGGFDATVSGAGTNYADQDSAPLALSDFTTSGAGSTTLTSATGGFTSQMVGNVVQIRSGTNFQKGYYVITGYTDTHNVTLDHTPTSGAAGTAGTGNVGGALNNPFALCNGGNATPTVPSGLVAGNTVNVRGTNGTDPASADYTIAGYMTFVDGDSASGPVSWVGYGPSSDRPRLNVPGVAWYQVVRHNFKRLKFHCTGSAFGNNGIIAGQRASNIVFDCIFDANGNDLIGVKGSAFGCWFKNSGSQSAGTSGYTAVLGATYDTLVQGNFIDGWRGGGIWFEIGNLAGIALNNVIANCGIDGVYIDGTNNSDLCDHIIGNTIYGCLGHGINISKGDNAGMVYFRNNILDSNGGYGVNITGGTSTALNDARLFGKHDYNAYRNNTSGARNGFSAAAHDVALSADPFTAKASKDFTLNSTAGGGAACRAAAFPGSFPS